MIEVEEARGVAMECVSVEDFIVYSLVDLFVTHVKPPHLVDQRGRHQVVSGYLRVYHIVFGRRDSGDEQKPLKS